MNKLSTMNLDRQKETLLRKCQEELRRLGGSLPVFPVTLDFQSVLALIANLQLALRHPANRGPSAEVARLFVDGIIERFEAMGLTANAELARCGYRAEYDEERKPQKQG